MNPFTRRVLFFLFFLSGFSSLVYQVVWTRMAFASFGIITPVLSVVLSVFMLGLAIGSWAGGRFIARLVKQSGLSAAFFYAGAELLIGLGAFAVPKLFVVSEQVLFPAGQMNSLGYLLFSALALAISIFPWCVCMGATFPFMMSYVRELDARNAESFSFLYLANVLGAMCGTFYTAVVLVEMLGFHHTLWVAAGGNLTIAFISTCLAWERQQKKNPAADVEIKIEAPGLPGNSPARLTQVILFSTGLIAMAMEVVWSRAFAVVLKTQVYSFALIVFTYLGATFLGSLVYRRDLRRNRVWSKDMLFFALAITAFLPVLVNDPRLIVEEYRSPVLHPASTFFLLASLCPFCALLGYLTPGLIDECAAGQPRLAGQAYAINILGCILGPLVCCYLLLPWVGERCALILLGLPFIAFWLALCGSRSGLRRVGCGFVLAAVLVQVIFFSKDFEGVMLQQAKNTVLHRDYMASVMSFGSDRKDKMLLVNGFGMTMLNPVTKFMAHLPLAFHREKPGSALVLCFGMGTSYRSALSWDIETTAVELVPGVTKAFGFYHADAANVLKDPHGHIVIDDGRRYLKRTSKKFDVIIVDPPPPVYAAGSSLLYSKEFYTLARQHLNPGGILQMWYPGGEVATGQAVARSIQESFPYVRGFQSVEGWGVHFLASSEPIEPLDANQLAQRMPERAKRDLLEWNSAEEAPAYLGSVVAREVSVPRLLNRDPNVIVTDDWPFNEYFLLRQLGF